ncbi:EpsG family protein [Proteus mirabilis]|uniref:EpsG family protein n=1 Tax=Proteus mirabilis TaxID=584 RepID=UPI0018C5618F|nr:EpsG family protein [Proteus mirabilis]MBG2713495.1 EpsG family protein [Proteus mirabilis]HEK0395662.1 EpsG family protein [Proteus mirabilis]HEK0597855.1 EpsG family protein [Proteus mirabilis]HEK1931401.1 EpsG family protein [Proteus mirabilis]HEK2974770.1 EpsG family protein [Proteus mirabilis]
MISHFIVYNFILTFSTFFAYLYSKEKNKLLSYFYITISLLAIITPTILRYDVGPDYKGYIGIFTEIKKGIDKPWYVEHLFYYISSLFSFSKHGYVYVLSIYFICSIILILNLSKKNNIHYVFLFFITLNIGYFTFDDQVRQALAMSIFAYSMKYIKSNEFTKYTIVCLIASICHTSALFMIPFFYIAKIKWPKHIMFIVILFSIISFYLGWINIVIKQLFSILPIYKNYAYNNSYTNIGEAVGSGLGVLLNVLIISICIISSNKKNDYKIINFIFFGIILLLISSGNLNISRMSKYFLIFSIFVLSDILSTSKDILFKIGITLFLILFFQVSIYKRYTVNLEYQSIFNINYEYNMTRDRDY